MQVKENENDSLIFLNTLSNPPSEVIPSLHILSTMAKVHGPWAFVYWQVHVQARNCRQLQNVKQEGKNKINTVNWYYLMRVANNSLVTDKPGTL